MRARAFALRDAFPDVLAGLYIREEFEGTNIARSNPIERQTMTDDEDWAQAMDQRPSAASDLSKACSVSPAEPKNVKPSSSIRRAPPPPAAPHQEHALDWSADRTDDQVDPHNHERDNNLDVEIEAPISLADHTAAYEPRDPEVLLDLFDSALCCALDLPTLEEIVDEFAERFRKLPSDGQRRAQRIIDRHHARVEDLDRSPATEQMGKSRTDVEPHDAEPDEREAKTREVKLLAEDTSETETSETKTSDAYASEAYTSVTETSEDATSATEMVTIPEELGAPLPRGLKELLPNLGLGRMPSNLRRRKRSDSQPQSLAAWNARTRLSEFKSQIAEDECLSTEAMEPDE